MDLSTIHATCLVEFLEGILSRIQLQNLQGFLTRRSHPRRASRCWRSGDRRLRGVSSLNRIPPATRAICMQNMHWVARVCGDLLRWDVMVWEVYGKFFTWLFDPKKADNSSASKLESLTTNWRDDMAQSPLAHSHFLFISDISKINRSTGPWKTFLRVHLPAGTGYTLVSSFCSVFRRSEQRKSMGK